jgi:hypothetical protein
MGCWLSMRQPWQPWGRSDLAIRTRTPRGSLAHFADVDKARMPEMLLKTSWEKIKADLEKLVARHSGT